MISVPFRGNLGDTIFLKIERNGRVFLGFGSHSGMSVDKKEKSGFNCVFQERVVWVKHIFDMKVSPYTRTADLWLDGQRLSSQSQLQVCEIDPLSNWYQDLPELLYSEVNDDYALRVQCLEIEYLMLTAVFANRRECTDLSHTALVRKYDTKPDVNG